MITPNTIAEVKEAAFSNCNDGQPHPLRFEYRKGEMERNTKRPTYTLRFPFFFLASSFLISFPTFTLPEPLSARSLREGDAKRIVFPAENGGRMSASERSLVGGSSVDGHPQVATNDITKAVAWWGVLEKKGVRKCKIFCGTSSCRANCSGTDICPAAAATPAESWQDVTPVRRSRTEGPVLRTWWTSPERRCRQHSESAPVLPIGFHGGAHLEEGKAHGSSRNGAQVGVQEPHHLAVAALRRKLNRDAILVLQFK